MKTLNLKSSLKPWLIVSLVALTAGTCLFSNQTAQASGSIWDIVQRASQNQADQNQASNAPESNRRSYMMTCRGGGNSSIRINTFRDNALIFNFSKAPQAATAAPIQPGQCAWQDRALRSEEPTTLIYPTEGLSLNLGFNPSTNNLSALEIYNNQGNRNSTPERLLNMIRSNQPFFIQAHRSDDGNSFIITHIGL